MDTPTSSLYNDSSDNNLRREEDKSKTLILEKNNDHEEESNSKDVSPDSPKTISSVEVEDERDKESNGNDASPRSPKNVSSVEAEDERDKESSRKGVSPGSPKNVSCVEIEDERDKESNGKDMSPESPKNVSSVKIDDKREKETSGKDVSLESPKNVSPVEVEDERDKESSDREVSSESTEIVPSTAVEDEDVDLGGDEPTREFDGNIDEDELLKDTDADEPRKNVHSVIETEASSNSETNSTLQFENLDTNQNVSSVQSSGVERQKEHIENVTDKNHTNIEDRVIGSSSNKNSELDDEAESVDSNSSIRPSVVDIDVETGNSKDTSLVGSNLDNEKNPRTDVSTDPSNETDNVSRDCNDTSQDTEMLRKESMEDMATDLDRENNENSKDSVEETENDEVTSFLHVDQDSSRPDDAYDTMEADGEDPFAQTDEAIDTSENLKDAELDQEQSYNENNESMDVDDNSSNAVSEATSQIDVQTINSADKTDKTESSALVESNENGDVTSSVIQPTDETVSSSKKGSSGEDKNASNESENNLKVGKTQQNEVCIVPDKVVKKTRTEESNAQEITVVNSSKTKSSKPSLKSKSKSKNTISDDSSDSSSYSDFEIGSKSGTRPKRSAAKKAESQIRVMSAVEQEVEPDDVNYVNNDADSNSIEEKADIETCFSCKKVSECKVSVLTYGKTNYFCDDNCFSMFRDGSYSKGEAVEIVPPSTVINQIKSADIQPNDRAEFIRKCAQCTTVVRDDDERTLSWETMDFCSEDCLGKYQQELGSHCANCKGSVQPASLGKYCVRFGYEVKQFCCSSCLEEFKKGLKVCSFCQKDISSGAEGFLAPVGDKGTFKDFCTQACMEKYEQMSSNHPPPPQVHPCHVCNNHKVVEVEVFFDSKVNKLCSDICFTAYKFANKLTVDRCDMCRKYFDKEANGEKFNIFYDGIPHNFCCKTCMNVYILAKRKIVPCNWCKVKKYNFDMIKRIQSTGQVLMMCSLNCLTLYQVSVNAVSSRRIKCDMCMSVAQAQYHLTMSDATIRNFCTYPCVMNFQQQYTKSPITLPGSEAAPIPTGAPKRAIQKNDSSGSPVPVISSIASLANGPTNTSLSSKVAGDKLSLMMRLFEPPVCRNKNTQTRPIMNTKSVSCRPHSTPVDVQTDEDKGRPILIPVPVPIYVPCPMAMYSFPFPVPVPIPIPVPIPVFLPTTKNSIKGILKEIKRIQDKVPTDPFEAELLMMAEMVAGDKKDVASSSDSDNEPDIEPPSSDTRPNSDGEGEFSTGAIEGSNTFGDDIMQMALKMATELDEPADLETQLTPATILNQNQTENNEGSTEDTETPKKSKTGESGSRKRSATKSPQKVSGSSDTKRKKTSQNSDSGASNPPPAIEEPKPDALMKLKGPSSQAWSPQQSLTSRSGPGQPLCVRSTLPTPVQGHPLDVTVPFLPSYKAITLGLGVAPQR